MNTVRRRLSNEDRREAHDYLLQHSGEVVVDSALTDEDKRICEQLFVKGFHHFTEIGWSQDKEANFLARPNVKMELDRQIAMLHNKEGIEQRAVFLQRLRMLQMLPAAISVVQRMLVGVTEKTPISKVPTTEQYMAARDVISWCGLSTHAAVNVNVGVGVSVEGPQIDRRALDPSGDDPSVRYEMTKVMQRTRVRQAIEKIVDIYRGTDDNVEKLFQKRERTRKKDRLTRGVKLKKKRIREIEEFRKEREDGYTDSGS